MREPLAMLFAVLLLGACAQTSDVTVEQNAPVTGTAAPVAGCPGQGGNGGRIPVYGDQTRAGDRYATFSGTPADASNSFRGANAPPPPPPGCY